MFDNDVAARGADFSLERSLARKSAVGMGDGPEDLGLMQLLAGYAEQRGGRRARGVFPIEKYTVADGALVQGRRLGPGAPLDREVLINVRDGGLGVVG